MKAALLVWLAILCPKVLAAEQLLPKPLRGSSWQNWVDLQNRELRLQAPIDICFFGDSLTQFWTTEGKTVWQAAFRDKRVLNCGIAADRLEHIWYRIRQSDFGQTPPAVFVVWAGTNNLAKNPPDSPEQVASALRMIAAELSTRCPQARILVLGLPPNGWEPHSALRLRIRQTATLLTEDAKDYLFIDLYPHFVDDNDQWKTGLTIDGTHLSAAGYRIVSQQIGLAIPF